MGPSAPAAPVALTAAPDELVCRAEVALIGWFAVTLGAGAGGADWTAKVGAGGGGVGFFGMDSCTGLDGRRTAGGRRRTTGTKRVRLPPVLTSGTLSCK